MVVTAHAAPQGAEPYVPTQLEWLEVQLNSCCREPYQNGASMAFQARAPATIVVRVIVVSERVRHAEVQEKLRHGRAVARKMADGHGWLWVQIEDEVITELGQ